VQAACAAGAAREDVVGVPELVSRAALADAHLERDGIKLNHRRALDCCLSMIFSENRYPLFGIALGFGLNQVRAKTQERQRSRRRRRSS